MRILPARAWIELQCATAYTLFLPKGYEETGYAYAHASEVRRRRTDPAAVRPVQFPPLSTLATTKAERKPDYTSLITTTAVQYTKPQSRLRPDG
jgi:hypothetical protein